MWSVSECLEKHNIIKIVLLLYQQQGKFLKWEELGFLVMLEGRSWKVTKVNRILRLSICNFEKIQINGIQVIAFTARICSTECRDSIIIICYATYHLDQWWKLWVMYIFSGDVFYVSRQKEIVALVKTLVLGHPEKAYCKYFLSNPVMTANKGVCKTDNKSITYSMSVCRIMQLKDS